MKTKVIIIVLTVIKTLKWQHSLKISRVLFSFQCCPPCYTHRPVVRNFHSCAYNSGALSSCLLAFLCWQTVPVSQDGKLTWAALGKLNMKVEKILPVIMCQPFAEICVLFYHYGNQSYTIAATSCSSFTIKYRPSQNLFNLLITEIYLPFWSFILSG